MRTAGVTSASSIGVNEIIFRFCHLCILNHCFLLGIQRAFYICIILVRPWQCQGCGKYNSAMLLSQFSWASLLFKLRTIVQSLSTYMWVWPFCEYDDLFFSRGCAHWNGAWFMENLDRQVSHRKMWSWCTWQSVHTLCHTDLIRWICTCLYACACVYFIMLAFMHVTLVIRN